MARSFCFFSLGIFSVSVFAQAELPLVTEYVQGHRCLVVAPKNLAPNAPVVLLLHGYGTNADEMLAISQEFHLPPCLMVFPDGPLPAGRSPFNHAWYNRLTHSRKDIERSRGYLFAVMDHFSKDYAATSGSQESLDPSDQPAPSTSQAPTLRPVIIMGFSQGAVMSLEAGLNYKGKIAAVVSMNGYMGEPAKTLAHAAAPRKTPVLLVHGTMDPIVQEEMTQATLEALRKAGYHPVSRGFRIGHKMTSGTLQAVSDFLESVWDHLNGSGA